MSIHTKTLIGLTAVANFAICVMAWIATLPGVLPDAAMMLLPWVIAGYGASVVSYGLDLISGQA